MTWKNLAGIEIAFRIKKKERTPGKGVGIIKLCHQSNNQLKNGRNKKVNIWI